MDYVIYLLCILVSILSFIAVLAIVQSKKSFLHFAIPMYMNMVVILTLYTKEVVSLGMLGILGVIPVCMKYKKNCKK